MSEAELQDLCQPQKTTMIAKRMIKKFYDNRCVITAMSKSDIMSHGERLDGCHIFGAGAFPQFKKIAINIVPIISKLHTGESSTFDWHIFNQKTRSVNDKFDWLFDRVHYDFRFYVREQLELLKGVTDGELV